MRVARLQAFSSHRESSIRRSRIKEGACLVARACHSSPVHPLTPASHEPHGETSRAAISPRTDFFCIVAAPALSSVWALQATCTLVRVTPRPECRARHTPLVYNIILVSVSRSLPVISDALGVRACSHNLSGYSENSPRWALRIKGVYWLDGQRRARYTTR